ncbi:MAG: 4Fe-4S dicluster domain-containing protein, partial [Gammaproteobacteria bacterium]|nr:4Fe-4S dicluster domain-containing protein [Gammaproteobacteria bacterium]
SQEQQSIKQQTRTLPATNIADLLKSRQEHAHWDDVAHRCLACGNCTAVCPSCFCHSEHDEAPLASDTVEHVRQWDSCFNLTHSYIHGIVIRAESKTRYRQWLTHKFSSWHEQYGRSGCTGCGRCISWCPVGIDVTQEVAALCGDSDE